MKLHCLVLVFAVVLSSGYTVNAKDMAAEAFLAKARRSSEVATYAMLDGTLQHRRRGGEVVTYPFYFGVIIMPERTIGQILVNNSESYLLGQTRSDSRDSTSLVRSPGGRILDEVGVRASDLTMSFLYYDFVSELPEETLSAVVGCRVLKLKSPDGKEIVKVYLDKTHAFPLKAEFFKPGNSEPLRVLETGGFTKKNELYYARRVRVEGPGWRTRIDFEPEQAQLGLYNSKQPPRIIRNAESRLDKKDAEK